jgi:Tol biopolymer transport system component
MTISAGTRLGPYEIVAPIGAGGMGEVYKARDTRLDRSVAVKILPAELAQNAQFKVRFEREAKTISQLSHPHICALYDVGDNYLVMELLDGETLADRIAKGPLPLPDVLKYGTQIAEALGKAHREGVVHRDLKPGNVMITKSGAKLLDFGLAKGGGQPPSAVHDATVQKPLTEEGTVLGTFQYMAPEQLAGEQPDPRTDIFALGAVLYEMATGKRAFEGKTKTSLIAAIVSGEPKPISSLQPLTPPALEHVIRKCLAKERDDRWQSASDIAEELRWIGEERPAAQLRRSAVWPIVGVAAVVALVLGALIGSWSVTRNRPPAPLTYTEIDAPEGTTFAFDAATAVISPDGKTIAIVVKGKDGGAALWLRPLDSPGAHMLRGTDNPTFPFWSPDSKYLGFFADGKLKRIEINSGLPETLAEAGTARGGSWSANGTILFSPTPANPIYAIRADGGEPRQLTELDIKRGDTSHRFPVFLPDRRHFLFFLQGASESNVLVGSIDSRETRLLTSAQAAAAFAPPDYVLFVREGALRAQHLDLKNLKLVGEAVSIADHVQTSGSLNFANVSVSTNGILTFVTGGSATISALTIVDKSGKDVGTISTANEQLDVSVAPDGHAVALSRYDTTGASDVWVCDLRRDLQTRQTFSPSNEFGPLWSPDSKSIVFSSFDKRPGDLLVKRVDSSGPGDVLLADRRRKIPSYWSRDGNYIIYQALTPGRQWDIEAWSVRDRKVIPLVNTPASEMHGQLSRDSRWLAYASSESGRMEVFVRPFLAGHGEHWQISGGGGLMPRWSPDGRKLYYVAPDGKLMAAAIHAAQTFSADAPQPMFLTRLRLLTGITRTQYDVLPDGRFLMNNAIAGSEKQSLITVVQNWTRKLLAQ